MIIGGLDVFWRHTWGEEKFSCIFMDL